MSPPVSLSLSSHSTAATNKDIKMSNIIIKKNSSQLASLVDVATFPDLGNF